MSSSGRSGDTGRGARFLSLVERDPPAVPEQEARLSRSEAGDRRVLRVAGQANLTRPVGVFDDPWLDSNESLRLGPFPRTFDVQALREQAQRRPRWRRQRDLAAQAALDGVGRF